MSDPSTAHGPAKGSAPRDAAVPSSRPLAGVHAVVTGGARGIGRAIADRLARDGATLTLIGRDAARLADAQRALGAVTACDTQVADVGDEGAVARAFAAVAAAGRGLGILVNNAGGAEAAPFAALSAAQWDATLRTNLTGTFLCTRAALPLLQAAPFGRIVNVASTAALIGYPQVAAYCAAKHGVVGLTRALALELARTAVTVNAVCPGYTDTDLAAAAVAGIVARTGRDEAAARELLAARNPQRRLVTSVEVADVVAFLCAPGAGAMTGQAISVSGGEVMTR